MPTLTRSAQVRDEPTGVRGAEDVVQLLTSAQELTPAHFRLIKRLFEEVASLDEAGRHAEALTLIEDLRREFTSLP